MQTAVTRRVRAHAGFGARGGSVVRTLGVAGAVILVWVLATTAGSPPDYLLPPVTDVFAAYRDGGPELLSNTWVTVVEIVAGLAVATTAALLLAVTINASRAARRALYPLLVALQSAPKEALAPVFIVWWGFSPLPKIVMAALIAFFPMVVATVAGLERFSEQQRLLAASMGASPLRTLLSFRLWVALPSFFSGLRLGITLAVVGAVLGEFLGSDEGLGYMVLSASRRLDGGLLYASLLLLIAVPWVLVRIVDVAEGILLRGVRKGTYVGR
jgi:NitT/TauT family transport system permease protein